MSAKTSTTARASRRKTTDTPPVIDMLDVNAVAGELTPEVSTPEVTDVTPEITPDTPEVAESAAIITEVPAPSETADTFNLAGLFGGDTSDTPATDTPEDTTPENVDVTPETVDAVAPVLETEDTAVDTIGELTDERGLTLPVEVVDAVNSDTATHAEKRNAAFGAEGGMMITGVGKTELLPDGTYRTALGHIAQRGHSHVSEIWGSKQPKLPDFHNTVIDASQNNADIMLDMSSLRVTDDFRLIGAGKYQGGSRDGKETDVNAVLSPNALSQLLARGYAVPGNSDETMLDTYFAGEAIKFPSQGMRWLIEHDMQPLVAEIINIGLAEAMANAKRGEKSILLRGHETAGEFIADAALSGRYGIIDNNDALAAILEAFSEEYRGDLIASHAHYDGRNMSLNILVPDAAKRLYVEGDSEYGTGIAVTNSETGLNVFRVLPFLFRAICLNGCIWNRRDSEVKLNKKHLGAIDWDILRTDIKRVVTIGVSEGAALLDQFNHARGVKVEHPDRVISHLGRDNTLSVAETRAWWDAFQKYEYEPTAFGVVNALTDSAKTIDGMRRTTIETVAGTILTPSLEADIDAIGRRWESYSRAAENAWSKNEKQAAKYVMVGVGGGGNDAAEAE